MFFLRIFRREIKHLGKKKLEMRADYSRRKEQSNNHFSADSFGGFSTESSSMLQLIILDRNTQFAELGGDVLSPL